MKKIKISWKNNLILSFLPITGVTAYSIYVAFFGFKGLCFTICEPTYGLTALLSSFVLYSYIFWPAYLLGIISFIVGLIKRRGELKCQN